jgi:hypothetical protein
MRKPTSFIPAYVYFSFVLCGLGSQMCLVSFLSPLSLTLLALTHLPMITEMLKPKKEESKKKKWS